jgi:hypothetical protein
MTRVFYAEFKNGSITKQKKQESRLQIEDHQDFSLRKMRMWLYMLLQAEAAWLYCRYKTKQCGSICSIAAKAVWLYLLLQTEAMWLHLPL